MGLDLDRGESLLKTPGQASKVVLAIVEHAPAIIERKQGPRGSIGHDAAPKDGGTERTARGRIDPRRRSMTPSLSVMAPGRQCST
jgi:hypothetical protein